MWHVMWARRGVFSVLLGKPEGRRSFGRRSVNRTILKWILEKWDGGLDWVDLAKDKNRWRALVNAVMNLRGP